MARERTTAQTGAQQGTGMDATASTASTTSSQSRSRRQGQQGQDESMVDQAKDTAHELASQAQEKVGEQVRSGVSAGKSRAANALGSVAQSLLMSSQQLRAQDQDGMSRYVERAANKVEQLSDYMQNTSPGEMADRVEQFARREPGLFLGGAFALGFLGARFLKSSRRDQEQQRWQGGAYRGTSQQRGGMYYGDYGASTGTGLTDREVSPPIGRDVDLASPRSASSLGTSESTRDSGLGSPSTTWGSEGPDRY